MELQYFFWNWRQKRIFAVLKRFHENFRRFEKTGKWTGIFPEKQASSLFWFIFGSFVPNLRIQILRAVTEKSALNLILTDGIEFWRKIDLYLCWGPSCTGACDWVTFSTWVTINVNIQVTQPAVALQNDHSVSSIDQYTKTMKWPNPFSRIIN